MSREMFLKVVAAALRKSAGRTPEEQAEAIAERMDVVAEALGEIKPAEVLPPPLARTGFPAYNPEAVLPVTPPEPEFRLKDADPGLPPVSLILPATSIPDPRTIKRVDAPPAPVRSMRAPANRMKVEDLNALIQERTPTTLTFNVATEGGGVKQMTYSRNVISRHAYDSVQLVYGPPGATPSSREVSEVQITLHVDDVPFDIPEILKSLAAQAADRLRPRAPIVAARPTAPISPVMPGGNDKPYSDIQAVFNQLG